MRPIILLGAPEDVNPLARTKRGQSVNCRIFATIHGLTPLAFYFCLRRINRPRSKPAPKVQAAIAFLEQALRGKEPAA